MKTHSIGKSRGARTTARPSPPSMAKAPTARGVSGTAANPSPQIPGVTTGAKTPNSGGIIQQGDQQHDYPADPGYAGPKPTGFLKQAPAPLAANRPQQTERADPLNGAGGPPQVPGTSRTVSEAPVPEPGKAMGFSSRGNGVPKGEDRHPTEKPSDSSGYAPGGPNAPGGQLATQPGDDEPNGLDGQQTLNLDKPDEDEEGKIGGHVGGSGHMARKFSNPTSANVYDDYIKKATGTPPAARIFSGKPAGKSSASMLKKGGPKDNGDEESEGQDY